jgi:hypothetical protein
MHLAEFVTGSAFWALMARWSVPDDQALQLIGQPPRASGKRPRFALNPDQAERLELLREVDRHATDIYQDAAGWLQRVNRSTMFGGRSPVDYMAGEGREALRRAASPEQNDLQRVGGGQATAEITSSCATTTNSTSPGPNT